MLNFMVKYQQPALDRTFAALADPTRRAIVARLAEAESVSVSELARPHAMSLPAGVKHPDGLSDAGLVPRPKTGPPLPRRPPPRPPGGSQKRPFPFAPLWAGPPP